MRRKEKEAPRWTRTCHCYSTRRKKRNDEDAQSRTKGRREKNSWDRTGRRERGVNKEARNGTAEGKGGARKDPWDKIENGLGGGEEWEGEGMKGYLRHL